MFFFVTQEKKKQHFKSCENNFLKFKISLCENSFKNKFQEKMRENILGTFSFLLVSHVKKNKYFRRKQKVFLFSLSENKEHSFYFFSPRNFIFHVWT